MFDSWFSVLVSPKDAFARESPNADFLKVLLWTAAAGAIGGLLLTFWALVDYVIAGTLAEKAGNLVIGGIMFTVMGAVGVPIIFFVLLAAFFLTAKALGGEGSFKTHAYLYALFFSPMHILFTATFFIPLLGFFVFGPAWFLYSSYLQVLVMKEAHKFSTARAVAAYAIPTVIFGFLLLVFSIALLAMLAPLMKDLPTA